MSSKILQSFNLNWCSHTTKIRCQLGTTLYIMIVLLQQVSAQNLVLQDTTIATTAFFSSQSITVGPNFSIANNGRLTLSAETIAIIPQLFILQGGELQVVTGGIPINVETTEKIIPDKFIVHQNYPNPFNPTSTIKYSIPKQSKVILKVFDIVGKELATLINKEQAGGNYEINFDATELTSGIYFYRIQAGNIVATKKMILLK
jgi:Secretion system C-terminal sorting domain